MYHKQSYNKQKEIKILPTTMISDKFRIKNKTERFIVPFNKNIEGTNPKYDERFNFA